MDSIEFSPTAAYMDLIEISNARKENFGLEGLSYRQLQRKGVRSKYGFELHHIVPNYRQKDNPTSYKNRADNIAILTPLEHLKAHKELSIFETGVFKYKALAAFLHLTNRVGSESTENESEIEYLANARELYYGSDAHIDGCKKSGKIAGEKSSVRWKTDPLFVKRMVHIFKDNQKVGAETRKNNNKQLMPWEISNINFGNGTKHTPQEWKFLDTIYIGVTKYGLSYSVIANVLGIPHKNISNIVRIIKKDGVSVPFKESRFYSKFCLQFESTIDSFEEHLKYYADVNVPWNKNKVAKCWSFAESFFPLLVEANTLKLPVCPRSLSNFSKIDRQYTEQLFNVLQQGVLLGYKNIKDFCWYKYITRVYEKHPKQDGEIGKRIGIVIKNGKWVAYDNRCIQLYTGEDYLSACSARDSFDISFFGGLTDLRHLYKYSQGENSVQGFVRQR